MQQQQFDLSKAFQTGRQGAQTLNYYQDRNIAEQQRQRTNALQDYEMGLKAQAQEQKMTDRARKDLSLIVANMDVNAPDFEPNIDKAINWYKGRNPERASQSDQFAQMPTEEKKLYIGNLRRQMGLDVKLKTEQLTLYGPDGSTKRVPVEKGKEYEPPKGWSLSKPKGKGIVVYDAEGNPQVSIGGDVSKKTQGTIEGGVVSDLSSLQQLNNIETLAQDNPELFTYGSQIGTGIDIIAEKAGFKRTPEERERLQKWQDLSMNISQSFNTYRKEITGAAASEQELKRLEQDYINKKMSHTQFMQALRTLKTKMERGLVLKQNLLQRGVKFNSNEYKKYFDSNGFPLKGKEVERPSVNERANIIKKENPSFTSDKIFEILADEGY